MTATYDRNRSSTCHDRSPQEPGSLDAIAEAVAAQRAFEVEPWPTALRVRMGVHTGEAEERTERPRGSFSWRCGAARPSPRLERPAPARRLPAAHGFDCSYAGRDALSSMRAMVGALRADQGDAPIVPTATLDDIRELATSDGAPLPVVVSLDAAAERLPGSVVASLHRIAIQALTNVRRHGTGARTVDVEVACGPQDVTLSVTNDGAAVLDRQQGFGLVGIAERAVALGGQFQAGPRPTGGWEVTAVLPTSQVDDPSR